MSWDVWICRFSRPYAAVTEIPDTERGLPLGTRAEVAAAITRCFPGTDWSDPAWGVFDAPLGSVEFNLGDADPLRGFTMHIRAGEAVLAPIIELCLAHRWQALDVTSGSFLERTAAPEAGLRAWLAFKDRALLAEPLPETDGGSTPGKRIGPHADTR